MLSWINHRFAIAEEPSRRQTTLILELLEGRDCPAAPVITDFTATPLNSGRWIELHGTVLDESPSAVNISLTGSTLGSAPVSADGQFALVIEAAALGTVFAQALDDESLYSAVAQAEIASLQPTLSLQLTQGMGRSVTVSGSVSDEELGQRAVTFSGMVTGSAVTNASGLFSFTTEATSLGTIQAVATDAWGQTSSQKQVVVVSNAPVLSLNVSEGAGGMVTVTGVVADEDPGSTTLSLSGAISAFISVSADGSFSHTGQATALGIIQATARDAWLQASGLTQVFLNSSVPSITALNIVQGVGRSVTLSGTVMDEDANSVLIAFGGVVSGSVPVNPDGSFSLTTEAAGLGSVQAVAQDRWGQNSDPAAATVAAEPPQIVDFEAYHVANGVWELRGRVVGDHAAGQDVTFGGLPSLEGQSAVTDENGNFVLQVPLAAGESGNATAATTDPYGQQSNTAEAPVNQQPPSVSFDYSLGSDDLVTITGTVLDDDPDTCTVNFDGIASGSVAVNADGSFSWTTPVSGLGNLEAVVTDALGQSSAPTSLTVTSAVPSISGLNVTYGPGSTITVTGLVSDDDPAGCLINLGGPVGGSATVDADGSFSYTAEATGLGAVQVTAADSWGQSSDTAEVSLTSSAPTLSTLTITYGADRSVTISGTVSDEEPGSCSVTFTGVMSGIVAVGSNGTFSFTAEATGLGGVQASAQDAWSQNSNQATGTLAVAPPQIVDFVAIELGNGVWEFRGQLVGTNISGRSVLLGGLPSLSGQVIMTDSSGCFAVQLQLGIEDSGVATAVTADAWGQESNVATAIVEPSL